MSRYLRNLIDTLIEESQSCDQLTNVSTTCVLGLLSYTEKESIADECLTWNWNVGSAKILGWLQEAHILDATEYVVAKYEQDVEATQLIMNDLLETQFTLLANLCQHFNCANSTSVKVVDILTESLIRLCRDLCESPTLLRVNYMATLDEHLLADQMHALRMLHLSIFLESSDHSTISEALLSLNIHNADDCDTHEAFASLMRSIVQENRNNMLVNLLQYSKDVNFKCWKFYRLFLKYSIANDAIEDDLSDMKAVLKGYVKTMFRKYLEDNCDKVFFAMILTVRQICVSNEKLLGSYAAWYKTTIGEMKYTLKTEEFNATMRTLTNMIDCENDPDILNIHINTAVPAPAFCNGIVLNYKQMCRSRLPYCLTKATGGCATNRSESEAMDVYVIDD